MEARILKMMSAGVLIASLSMPAAASVEIVERDGRFELQAPNETPRAVIIALAQRFGFEVVFPDQTWGGIRGDYERRGTLDVLLAYVLNGTNYVAKYWSTDSGAPTVTRLEIIGSLTGSSEIEGSAVYEDGVVQFELESSYEGVEEAEESSTLPQGDSGRAIGRGQPTPQLSTHQSVPPKSVVSQTARPQSIAGMLETRAEVQPASEQSATDVATVNVDQQAQLREMTQRAHAEVQDLAQALRQAEAAIERSAAEQN